MAKSRAYRWLSVQISREVDQRTKKVAKLYNISQAKLLGILVTIELEKLSKRRP